MAGMQFEYDEKGGTFYYFLLSFLALVLFPATYYFWPKKDSKGESTSQTTQCHCEPCQMKRQRLKAVKPWHTYKGRGIKMVLIAGWIVFALVAYKASQAELDFTEFDPYKELDIDRGAGTSEIKRAYRKLSLVYHPDKETGDPQKFMRISKAYKALTDEEARKNWEEYGNPDGPGATHFGIALPKWIVEKQNSVWVLAAYGLVFMIIMPVIVGTWWYRSIKYSTEQILMATTQLYYYFFHKTPNMNLKRVVMILAGSMEFEKGHNGEIVERPSDNEEIPALMRDLPYLNEKNKEQPLCYPYSVKSRAILHAHFSRVELPPKSLELDRQYLLKKCPFLLNEMVNIVAQLVAMAHAGRVSRMPRLETMENIMKVSQMVIQAMWESKHPLLQLPHITEDMGRHFINRRRSVRSIRQFVNMKEEQRRSMLHSLSDADYRDVINVCSVMPHIEMDIRSEVLDDEDSTITAGSIVTVTVNLKRSPMFALFSKETPLEELPVEEETKPEEDETEQPQKSTENQQSPQKKPKVWEKQKQKKKKKKKPKKPVKTIKKTVTVGAGDAGKKEDEDSTPSTPNGSIPRDKSSRKPKESNSTDDESGVESGADSEAEIANNIAEQNQTDEIEDDDDDWMKFQEEVKKENTLETKSKETHEVHCPYFPKVKYEWWWLYVADRRSHLLITAPVQVTSLKDEEEVQLKFSAPTKPGIYQYTVILRSDSYFDLDQHHNIKLDVKEAKKVESHPQWDISDEEEEKDNDEGSESDVSTDYDDSSD